MIDYIKIVAESFDYDYLLYNSGLDFERKYNVVTSEIEMNEYGTTKITSTYKGMQFVVKESLNESKRLIVTGSLHKFWNNGEHNYDDFGFNELYATIHHLSDILKVSPKNFTIHNLEFGVNIVPPIASSRVLKGLLIHKGLAFKNHSEYDADYYQVKHTNYIIKIYNKAKQFRSLLLEDKDILRIEIKQTRMNDIKEV